MRRPKPRLTTLPNRIHTVQGFTAHPIPKRGADIYGTAQWKKLVAAIVKQRGRRCEQCGKTHDERGKPIRIYGDHIIELKDGGAPLDPANVRLLDASCHSKKTHSERAKRTAITY